MSLILHCGAGIYPPGKNCDEIERMLETVLVNGLQRIESGLSAAEVATLVVLELESSRFTNAGQGSCLTKDGIVEVDATVCCQKEDEDDPSFASIGAAFGIDSPVLAAFELCKQANLESQLSPVRLLVGREAWKWCLENNLSTLKNESQLKSFQVTEESQKLWLQAKAKLNASFPNDDFSDTVGCLCVDTSGNIGAATSSGGPLFRMNGRVGPAGLWGAGVYIEKNVACCATGSSDTICRRLLSLKCVQSENLETPFENCRNIGVIRLNKIGKDKIRVEWAFSSPAIGLAFGAINCPHEHKIGILRRSQRLSSGHHVFQIR